TVPTVIPTGDTQFNRQQDQTNASLLSLGGGTRRGNNYTLDGVPITDLRNRASAKPTIEASEDAEVAAHTHDDEMAREVGGVRAANSPTLTAPPGAPVIIYDRVSRLPFPGNNINQVYNAATGTWSAANRINPVAAAMLKYLPQPDIDRDNGTTNYNRTSLINNNFEREFTIKGEHKFNDKVSLTGFFLYNATDEPCANYFGTADQTDPNRFADPLDYLLVRRPKVLALNNTWVLNDSSVMALRFGMTRFPDNNTLSINFDPSTLGFSQTFLNQITVQKFPQVRIRNGYDNEG